MTHPFRSFVIFAGMLVLLHRTCGSTLRRGVLRPGESRA